MGRRIRRTAGLAAGSGVGGLEPGDQIRRYPAALADLDALGLGPGPNRLGVIIPSSSRGGTAPAAATAAGAAALAATAAAGDGDVLRQVVPQGLGVPFAEIDLVVGPVQAKSDCLALPLQDGLAVQVVGKLENRTLRHRLEAFHD